MSDGHSFVDRASLDDTSGAGSQLLLTIVQVGLAAAAVGAGDNVELTVLQVLDVLVGPLRSHELCMLGRSHSQISVQVVLERRVQLICACLVILRAFRGYVPVCGRITFLGGARFCLPESDRFAARTRHGISHSLGCGT